MLSAFFSAPAEEDVLLLATHNSGFMPDMLVGRSLEATIFYAEREKLAIAGQSIRIVLHHKKRNLSYSASEPVWGENSKAAAEAVLNHSAILACSPQ